MVLFDQTEDVPMPEVSMSELMELYGQICLCHDCQLPQGFCPQLRPPGPDYKPGGVAFVQINPGQVGSLSDERIASYRTENARDIATRKASDTRRLVSLQEQFVKNPNDTTYERMRAAFFTSMSELWGWPPGKYRSTIESHGVALGTVACVNLAQCPVPDNSYRRPQLDHCWSKWTSRILLLLRPAVVVAQGKQVWDFMRGRRLPCDATLVEGLHHADRKSGEARESLLSRARDTLRDSTKCSGGQNDVGTGIVSATGTEARKYANVVHKPEASGGWTRYRVGEVVTYGNRVGRVLEALKNDKGYGVVRRELRRRCGRAQWVSNLGTGGMGQPGDGGEMYRLEDV